MCVEVKRDLRKGNVREEAIEQLAGYVASSRSRMRSIVGSAGRTSSTMC